jgi:hypothetical protein
MKLRYSITGLSLSICLVLGCYNLSPVSSMQSGSSSGLDVRTVTDEADAVLAIIAKRKTKQSVTDADWQRVFSSEGYTRLKERETGLKRPFGDQDFKSFVLSDPLAARAQALQAALDKWKNADLTAAAGRALTYLPANARIRAKIYPVIKPQSNSFVFEVTTDPAIFLYIDPALTAEKFENTVAHELHHIGYGGSCPDKQTAEQMSKLPKNIKTAVDWLGAFGEGFAMLAAAGGPDVHPHAVGNPEDRSRWDRDMLNYNEDLKKVERFVLDVIDNKLSEDETRKAAYSFFGIQGPWYTVGWKMAVVIEKSNGRARLIDCFCDPRKLLPAYNEAAALYNRSAREPLALWSTQLIEQITNASR